MKQIISELEKIIETLKKINYEKVENNIPKMLDGVYMNDNLNLIRRKDIVAKLTSMEADILKYLVKHEGIATHQELTNMIYGYDVEYDPYISKTIRQHVYKINQKAKGILKIKSVYGRGYILLEEEDDN